MTRAAARRRGAAASSRAACQTLPPVAAAAEAPAPRWTSWSGEATARRAAKERKGAARPLGLLAAECCDSQDATSRRGSRAGSSAGSTDTPARRGAPPSRPSSAVAGAPGIGWAQCRPAEGPGAAFATSGSPGATAAAAPAAAATRRSRG
eukprot:2893142-Prymnesium_polylepis.1